MISGTRLAWLRILLAGQRFSSLIGKTGWQGSDMHFKILFASFLVQIARIGMILSRALRHKARDLTRTPRRVSAVRVAARPDQLGEGNRSWDAPCLSSFKRSIYPV